MSKEKNKAPTVGFGLKSFEIVNYEPPKDEVDLQNLGYQIKFKQDADLDEETYSVDFEVTPKLGEKDHSNLGSIHTRSIYRIPGIKKLINEDGELRLPKGLGITFISIAFSSTRGALVAKSEGSVLAEDVMPLVDPKKLYENAATGGGEEI